MSHRPSIVLRYATRFAIPRVRRHLIAAMTLSLVVAQPAYAQDYDSIPSDSPIDISWGSPDLLEIAAQTAMDNTPTGNIPPTENPTETPTKAQPSPVPSLNPLTSSTSPPAIYTVKSGDTLWDIAKAHLPPGSTDSDIARACLIWTAANPTLANPNLIYPEQTLTIPQENLL
ncbi:MAG: LysM peptidoglycan-binding domain-containing protein [Actinomycetaceae bacterium]|nr:LysM peptidoglycan-binding domain-containing protein [Actinomycetaceae bacterium]